MTEQTTPAQDTAEFTSYPDFTARAKVGDAFREETTREITDWTVTAIQTDSSLSPRLVHLAGISTRHQGNPAYRYETRQVTQRADGTAPAYSRSVIIGRCDRNRLLATTEAKRFCAKALIRAHTAYTQH